MSWNDTQRHGGDVFSVLRNSLAEASKRYPAMFPELGRGNPIVMASDYSGESADSTHLVFSFLMISASSLRLWDGEREKVRAENLSDMRRMSFKRLGDKQRRAALPSFLDAANMLDGLSFTITLNKKCWDVFEDQPVDTSASSLSAFRHWKPRVLRKAVFAAHALGLMLGGLARPGQSVVWFTDEDDIAANDFRLRQLTQLFAWISSGYLEFDLGHLRCGTSRSDDGTRQLEDLIAIPDLIAGALAEQLNLTDPMTGTQDGVFWIWRPDMSGKAQQITQWFADVSHPLRRLVAMIEPSSADSARTVSLVHFYKQVAS